MPVIGVHYRREGETVKVSGRNGVLRMHSRPIAADLAGKISK
jgi:hypothetical protein